MYINSRGLVVRGSLMQKVGFYTEVYDNVTRFPQFVYDKFTDEKVLYGESFVKTFGNENGLDYFSSRAYLTFSPIPAMRVKFGKDRAFWGNGYQSLVMSDYGADYLLLTIQTRIWKLDYTNHFTQMIDFVRNANDTEGTFPRKYGVFHMLSYQPVSQLSLGIFESIIYNPWLPNGRRGFELQYMNPLIFYRAIEQTLNSPDNALLGIQWKYNFLKTGQFYGQILLDDYNFGLRDQGSGYRGNKLGYQLGIKYIDAFRIPTLDLQVEYNRLRPFTYQHFNSSSSYTHYAQHLGHAAGANLQDLHVIARYHPAPAWNFQFIASFLGKGIDEDGINYGGNANQPFINWPSDFNNVVGQGNLLNVRQLYGRISMQIGQSDVFAEVEGRYRQEQDSSGTIDQQSLSVIGGLRVNIVPRPVKF